MVEIPPGVDLLETIQHETLVRYFVVAGVVLFSYDVLTNVEVELKYIWIPLDPRQWSIQRAPIIMFNLLYLAQRYMPFLDQIVFAAYFTFDASTPRACLVSFELIAWGLLLGIALSEAMLSLRIWAVWAKKPSIGVILIMSVFGCMVPAMVFLARFLGGVQYLEVDTLFPEQQQLGRCLYLMKNKDVFVCWITLMIYDSVSFILMAIPGFKAYQIGGGSNLVRVVYRDGVVYYALIFMVSLLNVIIILHLSHDLVIVLTPFERVLHSILASHAILHIRRVTHEDRIQPRPTSDTWGGVATTLDFASATTTNASSC